MSVKDRQRREKIARREAIIAAAARVFAVQGLEGATIEMVAREAEVAVGTIYLYFCSRDDLFLSLIVERMNRLRERYIDIRSRQLEPMRELRTMARAYTDLQSESRRLFVAIHSVAYSKLGGNLKRREERDRFDQACELARECFNLWDGCVARLFEGNPGAAHGVASAIWAALNGAVMLTGDRQIFHAITGLDSTRLIEETLEFQLSAAIRIASAPARRSRAAKPRRVSSQRRRTSPESTREPEIPWQGTSYLIPAKENGL